ncbi:MAG: TonB family protein [Myxococcales bacterium]
MILALVFSLLATGENVREPVAQPQPAAPQIAQFPEVVESVTPDYPPDRLERGETAVVVLTIDIDEQGNVVRAEVAKGAGADFDQSALAAIRKFHFSPAKDTTGKPLLVRVPFTMRFVVAKKAVQHEILTGVVRGIVREAGTRRPIAGADVISDAGRSAITNAEGRYQIDLTPGERVLTISAPGYEQREVKVTAALDSIVEAPATWLHRTVVGGLEATVPGEKPKDAPTRRTLTHDELVNVPGSLNDPIRAVQNLPGLARSPFLGGQLLVRGSPPADTGTYLDGHRIPQLYHFLGGPSVINEQLLDRIDFFPGGYGAYYGRNLTGAIDVGTRKGDQQGLHGQASLDLIEAVGFVEGPVDSSTQVAVAARRSHIDLFLPLFIPNDPNRGVTSIVPIYWDYQARVDHENLSLLVFGSSDALTVIEKGGRRTLPLSIDTRLGFHRAVMTWKHDLSETLSLNLSPALGWTRQSFSAEGAGPGAFAQPQTGDVTILTGEFRADLRWKARNWIEVRAGTDVEFDRAAYSFDIQSSLQLRNLGILITQRDVFSRVQPAQLWGEFAEAKMTLGKLELTPGLRFDQYHWREHARWSIDPRLWGRYALSDTWAVKSYVGLYHEPPNGQQIDIDVGNPDLGLEWALQVGAGVEHRISDVWNVSAEVFYNRRGSLIVRVDPVLQPDQTVYNPRLLNNGIGRSYGLELWIRREITARLYGWLAYTLSKSEILPNPGDQWRAFQFDQTHILTLVVGYRPTPGWELSTRYRLVSGNPIAPVDYATFDADTGSFIPTRGTFGDAREPLFSQLDGRAQYTWTWTYWQLSLYLDVQNVTNRTNEEFHVYDYRYRDQGSISGLPILPTFGVKGKF